MYKELYPHDDLENLMEELVYQEIDHLIKQGYDMPGSEISIQDIAAIALNQLPPRYISSILDKKNPSAESLKKLDSYKPLVKEKVLQAIEIVQTNPHD